MEQVREVCSHGAGLVEVGRARGYLLSPVSAPGRVGESGELSFQIRDEAGNPLLDYKASHRSSCT